MDSMEIGTFISFSNSFCSLRNIYFKFCFENPFEEEVILLKMSTGSFSPYYMEQTMGSSHLEVFLAVKKGHPHLNKPAA